MAVVRDFTALLGDSSWSSVGGQGLTVNRPTVLTYSFLTAAPASYASALSPAGAASFQPLNETEKAAARQAIAQHAAASGLTFHEVSGDRGDVRFSWMDGASYQPSYANVGGWGYGPQSFGLGALSGSAYLVSDGSQADIYGDVFGNLSQRDNYAKTGSLGLWLHEIGHALGLKHPFDGSVTLASDLDNYANTIMSYTSNGAAATGLGPLDVEALRHLYGGPGTDGTQFASSKFDGRTETFAAQGTAGPDRMRGTGTHDRLGGGDGADTLYGGSGNDVIAGGRGLDVASGGAGTDVYMTGLPYVAGSVTRTFSNSASYVSARMAEGVEILTDFETLRFTNGDFDVASMTFRPDAGDDVFRFYNPTTGAHFYTYSPVERDDVRLRLPEFTYEGNAFDTDATAANGMAVFRFFNTGTGTHFYTASAAERDQVKRTLPQFNDEGTAYFAYAAPENGQHVPLYRFFETKSGVHFYTASATERDTVIAQLPHYRYEGVAYYVDLA